MTILRLIKSSFVFYRRTNVWVFLAVVVSIAVLAGSLVIGDSVSYSLDAAVSKRLGKTSVAMISQDGFFTEGLSDRLAEELDVKASPVLLVRGVASNGDDSRRANSVQVLGVDDRFFAVAGADDNFDRSGDQQLVVNRMLAERLGVKAGDEVLLRIEKPSLMSREIALTPDSDLTFAVRLTVGGVLSDSKGGAFSLGADQVSPMTAFVQLGWLGEQLGVAGGANMLLVAGDVSVEQANEAVKQRMSLADMGLEIVTSADNGFFELKSNSVFIDADISARAIEAGEGSVGILTYFANSLRSDTNETPYSMVSAISKSADGLMPLDMADDEIIINEWLAADLVVGKGDMVKLDYFVITSGRKLQEQSSKFFVRDVVGMAGMAGDRSLMPDFPGLADVDNCRDWEPGIPIDLDKIRDKDEEYWDNFKGTPKAFVTLEAGQKIWSNRYGNLTAVRYPLSENSDAELGQVIVSEVDPALAGLYFVPVRSRGILASEQGTDFGQLFMGLSMFLIAAALVLVGLIFAFGVEKRSSEIGVLLALGFEKKQVRRLFLFEALVLVVIGAFAGIIVGLIYTKAMIYGLSGLWRGAVGNSQIVFHAEMLTLLEAGIGGVVVCIGAIWFAFRKQFKRSASDLLDGNLEWQFLKSEKVSKGFLALFIAGIAVAGAIVLVIMASKAEAGVSAGAFFGAGGLLLVASILFVNSLLKLSSGVRVRPSMSLVGLAWRNSTRRRGRSLAVVTMLACGVFMVIAVGANRHDPLSNPKELMAGTGGFRLMGETSMPILYDLNTAEGRNRLGVDDVELEDVDIVSMRVRDGDDASCLNLNRAQQPRLYGVDPGKLKQRDSFVFIGAMNGNDKAGWDLLDIDLGADVVGAVGDEATVKWGLGKGVGDRIEYTDDNGRTFSVQIVGVLKNSILQGNLLISESDFTYRFPGEQGYRKHLIDTSAEKSKIVSRILSGRLQDFGMEVTETSEVLRAFSAVENTYLSIFQLLGSFGLILGSVGLGLVVLGNVLDRSGELAMMRAVGFSRAMLKRMIFYEHLGIMFVGLIFGSVSALIAVFPAFKQPGGDVPYLSLGVALLGITVSGVLWIWFGTSMAIGGPIMDALRNE